MKKIPEQIGVSGFELNHLNSAIADVVEAKSELSNYQKLHCYIWICANLLMTSSVCNNVPKKVVDLHLKNAKLLIEKEQRLGNIKDKGGSSMQ